VGLGVKSLALLLVVSSPVAARVPGKRRTPAPASVPATAHVTGMLREEVLELPLGATPTNHQVRALPGTLGFEIQLAVPPEAVAAALDALPAPWRAEVRALEGGVRIRVVHTRPGVAFATSRSGATLRVAYGIADEQTRLRAFATMVRLPLPEPEDLGAELEVWQDAERQMASGDLPEAKRLWERLAEVPRLADLAALRVAELYIASGHINEALSQLRAVSRNHPRSAGAALARLDVLHLETLIGGAKPTLAQIDIAAAVIDRAGFDEFAALRASMVLRDLGNSTAALSRIPDAAPLPELWRLAAESLRQDLVADALIGPALRGDPRGTAIAWERWSAQAEHLDDRDIVTDVVSEAHERLGLFETALPMLQQHLRKIASAADEADLVGRVAHAYRMLGDVERASFAIDFQLGAHADAPGLHAEIEALAITKCATEGLPAARTWLAAARKRAASAATSQAIDAIDDELVLGWGTPAQIVHSLGSSDGSTTMNPATPDTELAIRNARALAVALVRVGRHAPAAEMLRNLAGRTEDPNERDRLSYYLGVAEQGLGRHDDAQAIFRHISTHGTTFGQLAITRLQEQRLANTVKVLSSAEGSVTP
jgi:tetratricopeptide (TPR) repeat protein